MADTSNQYNDQIEKCRELFIKKMHDYGSAWRILRLPSLTDQIFIKAQRIRGLQKDKEQKIAEGQTSEFIGIVNYSVMALIQIEKGVVEQPDLSVEEATRLYDEQVAKTKQLMSNSSCAFLITKTGMVELRTIFSVFEPINTSFIPLVP